MINEKWYEGGWGLEEPTVKMWWRVEKKDEEDQPEDKIKDASMMGK